VGRLWPVLSPGRTEFSCANHLSATARTNALERRHRRRIDQGKLPDLSILSSRKKANQPSSASTGNELRLACSFRAPHVTLEASERLDHRRVIGGVSAALAVA